MTKVRKIIQMVAKIKVNQRKQLLIIKNHDNNTYLTTKNTLFKNLKFF